MNDIFKGLGIEVILDNRDDFLKVKETLTRIGIASKKSKSLTQSVLILHKTDKETNRSRYRLLMFKELFLLDGKTAEITEQDIQRRNAIALLLDEWELLRIDENCHKYEDLEANSVPISYLKILTHKESKDWELITKYTIGNKK